jgi:hypothetical protein
MLGGDVAPRKRNMKSANEGSKESRWKMDWLNLLVSVIAIVASLYAIYLGHKVSVQLSQYDSMNKLQTDLVKNMYDEEDYLDVLIKSHNIKEGQENALKNLMSAEEKQKLNDYIARDNYLLGLLFVIMPDKSYQAIVNTI